MAMSLPLDEDVVDHLIPCLTRKSMKNFSQDISLDLDSSFDIQKVAFALGMHPY